MTIKGTNKILISAGLKSKNYVERIIAISSANFLRQEGYQKTIRAMLKDSDKRVRDFAKQTIETFPRRKGDYKRKLVKNLKSNNVGDVIHSLSVLRDYKHFKEYRTTEIRQLLAKLSKSENKAIALEARKTIFDFKKTKPI